MKRLGYLAMEEGPQETTLAAELEAVLHMTEGEWFACDHRIALWNCLEYHRDCLHYPISTRKMRLYGCACSRVVWHLLRPSVRAAVESMEARVDGRISRKQLKRAVRRMGVDECPADTAARIAVEREPVEAQGSGAEHWAQAALIYTCNSTEAEANHRLIGLFRDIFGNPFRPVAIDPAWLRWNGGTVVQLAAAIYDERRFQDLPILADALEEAGCTDAHLLDHCRQPGEHARGCWLLDHLLGKQ
jgi:hypothetical protein